MKKCQNVKKLGTSTLLQLVTTGGDTTEATFLEFTESSNCRKIQKNAQFSHNKNEMS